MPVLLIQLFNYKNPLVALSGFFYVRKFSLSTYFHFSQKVCNLFTYLKFYKCILYYRNAVHIMALVEYERRLDLNSDIDLMLRVQKGEIDILGILFERYKQQLFGFFLRTTGNKAASEDMVQNVFLRILKYKDKFSGYGKFTSWMYQIARNVSFDYFKKNIKYEILATGLRP